MGIKFGTEGWRAIIADEFTMDNVRTVVQAIAEHVVATSATGSGPLTMAVGYDTRFLSDRFAQAACEVLAANGVRSILSDRMVPTCAVSRYVVAHRLASGIMITASHNPSSYNGIKVKEAFGGSANTDTIASIEGRIGHHAVKRLAWPQALEGGMSRVADFLPDFEHGIRDAVDLNAIRRSRLNVVVDAMHGTADRMIERLVSGGRCRVETLHANPDPLFGGHAPEPIAVHLEELARAVKRRRGDVGIANDGDADRIGAIAPNGLFIHPGQILCILLEHLIVSRQWRGAVVKTVSNTSMINRMAQALGLNVMEVPVGFKHIAKLMMQDDVLIGGEESGGIGIRGYLPERDGILMGLLLMEALAAQGRSVREILRRLERRYGRWVYTRKDLTVDPEQVNRVFERLQRHPPTRMAGVPVRTCQRLDGVKLIDRQDNWLLFRRSGTEPIVRVYAEGVEAARAKRLLDFGVRLVRTS